MNGLKAKTSFNQTADPKLNHCWWMEAGVVDYKLCDRDYDCEHCPFDEGLHGRAAKLTTRPADLSSARPGNQQLHPSTPKECVRLSGIEIGQAANHLFFHPGHTWARIEEGGTVRSGIDDFGQRMLGRAYSVTLPSINVNLRCGEESWRFTHQTGVTALVAPVSGTVKEVNANLIQRPSLLNHDPYGEGWTILIEPTDLKGCLRRLLYGEHARQWRERELEKLSLKLSGIMSSDEHSLGTTLNDGGLLRPDFMKGLSAEEMRQVIKSFFPYPQDEDAKRNNSKLVQDRR